MIQLGIIVFPRIVRRMDRTPWCQSAALEAIPVWAVIRSYCVFPLTLEFKVEFQCNHRWNMRSSTARKRSVPCTLGIPFQIEEEIEGITFTVDLKSIHAIKWFNILILHDYQSFLKAKPDSSYPVHKLIWVTRMRRFERREGRKSTEEEQQAELRVSRVVSAVIVLVFSFLFNRVLWYS